MTDGLAARFHAGASETEGISGQLEITTEFENTVQVDLELVSSDKTRYEDLPAAHDIKTHEYPHRRS